MASGKAVEAAPRLTHPLASERASAAAAAAA